jgi:hypothetical protein
LVAQTSEPYCFSFSSENISFEFSFGAEAMFASVTRLRVRSLKYLPAFLWMTFRSQRQVLRATGFLGGRLLLDAKRTFWTLTVSESERAMNTFRGGGLHAQAMP